MAQHTFRFQFRSGAPERAGEAEQVSVSARIAHAAWLAWRYPSRVTRGYSSSRNFSNARARRRMSGGAERAARTVLFQTVPVRKSGSEHFLAPSESYGILFFFMPS